MSSKGTLPWKEPALLGDATSHRLGRSTTGLADVNIDVTFSMRLSAWLHSAMCLQALPRRKILGLLD
jgi:hypothetical protein